MDASYLSVCLSQDLLGNLYLPRSSSKVLIAELVLLLHPEDTPQTGIDKRLYLLLYDLGLSPGPCAINYGPP